MEGFLKVFGRAGHFPDVKAGENDLATNFSLSNTKSSELLLKLILWALRLKPLGSRYGTPKACN